MAGILRAGINPAPTIPYDHTPQSAHSIRKNEKAQPRIKHQRVLFRDKQNNVGAGVNPALRIKHQHSLPHHEQNNVGAGFIPARNVRNPLNCLMRGGVYPRP